MSETENFAENASSRDKHQLDKKQLLDLLQEEEVIARIEEITDGGVELPSKELKEELEQKKERISELESKNDELKSDNEDLKSEKKKLETKITSLKDKQNNLGSDLKNKETKIDDLEERNNNLNKVLKRKKERIADLKSDNKKLKTKISDLNDQIEQKEAKITSLETDLKNRNKKLENLKETNHSLQQKLKVKEEKINKLETKFADLEEIYQTYQNLSVEVKEALDRIFLGDSIKEFIYCGVQYDSLESLWDYTKRRLVKGQQQDLDKLKEIFNYFFTAYNKVHQNDLYQRQEVEVGYKFDNDKYIRSKNSKTMGQIKEVLFKGYINLKTDKLVKQSVVRAEK